MTDLTRTRRDLLRKLAALGLLASTPEARAAEEGPKDDKTAKGNGADKSGGKSDGKSDAKPPAPKSVTRELSGLFHGEHINYSATAGEIYLKNEKGEPTASIFNVAYVKKGTEDLSRRPVTFVFNGGPGSASLWLHLGLLGPKRVVLPENGGNAGAAPYQLADNPGCILDTTDLVFIDPVGTGYSKALGDAKDEDFWGLQSDAQSIAAFIRLWVTETGRWNSPKYLAGESYGTTRAAEVIAEIQTGYDTVTFHGVALISSVLDFHTMTFREGNDLPYVAFLPSYAAVAWYHNKINPKPPALAPFLDEVRAFAGNEYLVGLLKGSSLSGAERETIVGRLAHYTGLSATYIAQADLRIRASRFMKELLRDQGKTLGRYDGRVLGEDRDAAGETPDDDASLYAVDGAFVTTINDYLSRILKVGIDRPYKILENAPNKKWKWAERAGPANFVNVAPPLGEAMRQNRDFRVFVASGYYDLAAPFFGTDLSLANNGIKPDRVTKQYFEAGHMMYTDGPSRDRLSAAIRDFIRAGR